jgi:hypothetical protein
MFAGSSCAEVGILSIVFKRNRNFLQHQQESPFFEGCFCQNKDCFVYFEFTLRASLLIPYEPDDLWSPKNSFQL